MPWLLYSTKFVHKIFTILHKKAKLCLSFFCNFMKAQHNKNFATYVNLTSKSSKLESDMSPKELIQYYKTGNLYWCLSLWNKKIAKTQKLDKPKHTKNWTTNFFYKFPKIPTSDKKNHSKYHLETVLWYSKPFLIKKLLANCTMIETMSKSIDFHKRITKL